MSSAVSEFDEDQLGELLAHSQSKNHRLGLTGLLLYKEGEFMQALEGDDVVVRDLYATIAADHRHTGVRTMYEKQIEQRDFPQWTMGLRQLSDGAIRAIPGYDDFFDVRRKPDDWATQSRSRLLLEWFRHHQVA